MKKILAATVCIAALAACGDSATEVAEDRVEDAAEASAATAGPAPVALGLSEAQLLEADLRAAADGTELGDVTSLLRAADGRVDRLLVEIEDSNPDRFVEVPVGGLTVLARGNDTDLVTTMTAAQLAALPEATLPTP